jgi:hypothetical protein
MGYKTDSEAKVVEQRDSEIQVEAKGLVILQEKVLETQGMEQNDSNSALGPYLHNHSQEYKCMMTEIVMSTSILCLEGIISTRLVIITTPI